MIGLLTVFALAMLPDILYLRYANPGRTALMQERGGPVQQSWVSLQRISPQLLQAVMLGEDLNFYHHYGIDFYELKRSLEKNFKEKRWARGGSTITMQLAKNLYLSTKKTPLRKILELILTLELEQSLSKGRILELYLNLIEWGENIYGVEAAAQHYFAKSAAGLTASESAWLAAIIPNPRRYSLPGYERYAERRKRWIFYRMGHPKKEPSEEMPTEPPSPPEPEEPEELEPEPLPPESGALPEETEPAIESTP